MMSKRGVIVLLVGVNLALLAGLILITYTPSPAMAQAVTRSGEYILVAAEAQLDNDVIYLLDLGTRQLHAFRGELPVMAEQPIRVRWYHSRDLARDFRR